MLQLVSPFIIIYKALYLFIVSLTGNYGISLVLLSFITFLILTHFLNKKDASASAIRKAGRKPIRL